MGKKWKTLLTLYLGFSLGILSVTGTVNYISYKYSKKRLEERMKKADVIRKVYQKINETSKKESMVDEFRTGKQYLEIDGHKFDLEDADILKYHKGDDRLVVYIQDMHNEKDLQEKIYNTIDELREENNLDLLVLENLPNKELTKDFIASQLEKNSFLDKFVCLAIYGFWVPETKKDIAKMFDAGITYEFVNDKKINTYGAESEDFHDTAAFIALRTPKSEDTIWLYETIILHKRSEKDVKNTIQRMKETGEDKAIFVCGAGHTKGIMKVLEEEGVSYLIIQPQGLYERLEAMLGERTGTSSIRKKIY